MSKDVKKTLMGELFRDGQVLNQKIPLHQYQGHSSLVKIYSKLKRIINSKTVRWFKRTFGLKEII